MKFAAAIFADFDQTFLGGPSRLLESLGGRPLIVRTLQRLARVDPLEARFLVIRPQHTRQAESAVEAAGLNERVSVLPVDDGQRRRGELIRAARKWNLEAWRGGILGTTWFDEFIEPRCVARLLSQVQCDAVLCLNAYQPFLDVEIASGMLSKQRDYDVETQLVFTQAPPGLAGIVLTRDIVARVLEHDMPLGLTLAYRPEMPQADPINQPPCYHVDPSIEQTPARLTGDTRRSFEQLAAAVRELGDEPTSADLLAWLRRPGNDRAGPLPVEVELELTTDDPLPETTLRPRGDRVPRRQLGDLDAVGRLADRLGAYDDRLVVLAGHGDPLLHPQFGDVCRLLRQAGVCGIAVDTPLVALGDAALSALFDTPVDLVRVYVDAHSNETYRVLNRSEAFDSVLANIGKLEALRRDRVQARPIVATSLTRCEQTLPEMEAFYDAWIQRLGWAVIEGYNDYCGVLPPDTALSPEPPVRGPCRRLARRLVILADGTVAPCRQDIRGVHPLGNCRESRLDDVWNGAEIATLRQAHQRMELDQLSLCAGCHDWFRP